MNNNKVKQFCGLNRLTDNMEDEKIIKIKFCHYSVSKESEILTS